MARWDQTNYTPRTAPKGHVPGLGDAVQILRRELGKVELTHDRFGNGYPLPPADKLPEALAAVKAAGFLPAVRDFLSDFPEADHETVLLQLVGDPGYSDADVYSGPASQIPFCKG